MRTRASTSSEPGMSGPTSGGHLRPETGTEAKSPMGTGQSNCEKDNDKSVSQSDRQSAEGGARGVEFSDVVTRDNAARKLNVEQRNTAKLITLGRHMNKQESANKDHETNARIANELTTRDL